MGANELNLLQQASHRLSQQPEPQILLFVNSHEIAVPERVLCDALSHLAPATVGHVPVADYAASVAFVLTALERRGVLSFRL
jgi:hypothetical protein